VEDLAQISFKTSWEYVFHLVETRNIATLFQKYQISKRNRVKLCNFFNYVDYNCGDLVITLGEQSLTSIPVFDCTD
jgi:hypothetical protein